MLEPNALPEGEGSPIEKQVTDGGRAQKGRTKIAVRDRANAPKGRTVPTKVRPAYKKGTS